MERWRGKGSCLPPGRVCPLAVFAPWPCLPPGGSGYEALSARLRGSSSRPCERAKHPSSGDPRRRAVGRPSLVAARSNTPTERAASTSTRRIHIHIHATSASTPRPHPRGVGHFCRKMRSAAARPSCARRRSCLCCSRRGTEPQRARPPRCEALPPKPTDLRVGQPTFGSTGAGSSSGPEPRRFRSAANR